MSFVKAMIVIVIHVCMCRWVGGRCFEIFGAIERCMLGLGGRYFEDPVEASSWRGSDECSLSTSRDYSMPGLQFSECED